MAVTLAVVKVRVTVISEIPHLKATKAILAMRDVVHECGGTVSASFYTVNVEDKEAED